MIFSCRRAKLWKSVFSERIGLLGCAHWRALVVMPTSMLCDTCCALALGCKSPHFEVIDSAEVVEGKTVDGPSWL